MSRLLRLMNDPRKVPDEACWWRLRTRANADCVHITTQIHIPDERLPWDGKWMPWSSHSDYFDGRNDWSMPYACIWGPDLSEDRYDDSRIDCPTTILIDRRCYLDLLDVRPPDVSDTSRWLMLTPPGYQDYPTEGWRKNYFWPRSRQHWLPVPNLWPWQSIGYPAMTFPMG